jgi:transposase InsO family protein
MPSAAKSRRVAQLPLFQPPISTPRWESLPYEVRSQILAPVRRDRGELQMGRRLHVSVDRGRLAAVMDLFSRRIVGWSMSSQMTAQLVTHAMLMAIWRRGPVRALLHHSDQGSQPTSEQFQKLLKEHGVTCSMSRSGDCWDNAAMESFFSSFKTERTSRRNYQTRDEARADAFDYIEHFYNPRRRHSTLGYLSPIDYEKAANSG